MFLSFYDIVKYLVISELLLAGIKPENVLV
jgi:hypothetical protein